MPTKELDHPYCAAMGTTATDMTTRWALQSSMMAATSATTLARSGNADDAAAGCTALATAAAAAAAGTGRTPSKLALHVATTSRCLTLGSPPSTPRPPLTTPLPLLLAAQPPSLQTSAPDTTDEECIRSLPGAPMAAAPTLVDLYTNGLTAAFAETHDLTGAIAKALIQPPSRGRS
jgi:hypothetical protein